MKDLIIKTVFSIIENVAFLFRGNILKAEQHSQALQKAIAWAKTISADASLIAEGKPVPSIDTGIGILNTLEPFIINYIENTKNVQEISSTMDEIAQNLEALLNEIAPPAQVSETAQADISGNAIELQKHADNIQAENQKSLGDSIITNSTKIIGYVATQLQQPGNTVAAVKDFVGTVENEFTKIAKIATSNGVIRDILAEAAKLVAGLKK